MNDEIKKGYIYLPYIVVNVKNTINGETVWYRNKLLNFLLKIKRFFIKSKLLNSEIYKNKLINNNYYGKIKID